MKAEESKGLLCFLSSKTTKLIEINIIVVYFAYFVGGGVVEGRKRNLSSPTPFVKLCAEDVLQ